MTLETILETIRCPACHGRLAVFDDRIEGNGDRYYKCATCSEQFPTIRGVPRLLLSPLRRALLANDATERNDNPQIRTAFSFGYEWSRFPEMYQEWEQTFFDYMQPHGAEFFYGKKVLDAGCGNGRFAYYAARHGAEVWAIDLGS